MKKTTIEEILTAAEGKLISGGGDKYITGIKHDSRECGTGDMFVAIAGENQDGHKYIPGVFESGCNTVLVSHLGEWTDAVGDNMSRMNVILVNNTVEAIGKLAEWYLKSLNIRKAAVTGSVGKTSTRDMVYYVLSEKYNCGRNLKNFNNNIGLPVSIFRFDEKTEAAVLEMGMDAFGEISYLSNIVKPDVGIITNIGVAHMEKLGSREGIFKAKMEIAENIAAKEKGGSLVFAGDGEFLTKERTCGDYTQTEVGYEENCDYIISDVDDFGIEGIKFKIKHLNNEVTVKLPVAGEHNAVNATLAIAAGNLLGVSMEEGARGLAKATLTGSRLKKVEGKSVRIIDDTYNANPDSMISALDVMQQTKAVRRVAVLGDMFELGDNTCAQHRSVGEHAARIGTDLVIAIGDLAEEIAKGAGGIYFPTKEDFLEKAETLIKPDDLILVKGSRGMKMEVIVEKLKEI